METTNSIQLQFRSGDDLFNNYGIGIIRQVVDKSENIIKQKKEEMRQLVGGKYLDMLQVSDTISSMNSEFRNICSSVNNILSVCDSIESEYVYTMEDPASLYYKESISPESLWDAYDNNDMLRVAKNLILFKEQQNEVNLSLNKELFSYFPEMAMKKCVKQILEMQCSKEQSIELFASFYLLSSIQKQDQSCESFFSLLLDVAGNAIDALFTPLSVQSILQSITSINSILQSVLLFFDCSAEEFSLFSKEVPALSSQWRDSNRSQIFTTLQTWIEEEFECISESSKELISQIQSVNELAELKRQVKEVSDIIHDSWVNALSVIMNNHVNDPIERLFTMLFKEQSISIIHSCFVGLKDRIVDSISTLLTLSNAEIGPISVKMLHNPISELYHDLTDLEYSTSDELIAIVGVDSSNLFSAVFDAIPKEGNTLHLSYLHYSMYSTCQKISSSYHINLEDVLSRFLSSFEEYAKQWITEQMNSKPLITDYFHSLKWTMRDSEWYEAVSGWKEYSLGSIDDEKEEVVLVPGSCSPCLMEQLMSLCSYLDLVGTISEEKEYTSKIHSLFVCESYHIFTSQYESIISSLMQDNTEITSPGLLLLLFDLLYLEKLVNGTIPGDGLKEDSSKLRSLKSRVIDTMDPVDWTLAESYMNKALEESISGVALLISLLLPSTYNLHSNVSYKSLSKNANILFTPVEKLTSYPISSQSMQLLLQSQLKGL